MQSGIRRVYYPVGLPDHLLGYEWSFLRPTSTLYVGASGTDGTTVSGEFDSATFTDWVAQGVTTDDTVTISDSTSDAATIGEYSISVVGATLTLASDPGDATGIEFLVGRDPCNYTLPDDLGRIVGNLHYAADEQRSSIQIVPLADILQLRARNDESDAPRYAATRPKSSDGSAGQRQEILFWPKANAYWPLSYAYEAYQGALSDANPYPLGGMQMTELYIESCLAVAEQRSNDEGGLHTQLYQSLLIDAVARDAKKGPSTFGHMGHKERLFERKMHGDTASPYPITYKGNTI
ncbi:MAG: hypothetical protein ACYTEO_18415 [Planctomycetota bacterium]